MITVHLLNAVGGGGATQDLSHILHVAGCDRAAVDVSHEPFSTEYSTDEIEIYTIARHTNIDTHFLGGT